MTGSTTPIVNYQPSGLELSYNGFNFIQSGQIYEISNWQCEPQYDDAQRAVWGNAYTLTIKLILSSDSTNNSNTNVTAVRTQLTKPGGILTIKGFGFGDIAIGGNGTQQDLKWGPKPQLLKFNNLAGGVAWEIVWNVQFIIGECQYYNGSLGNKNSGSLKAIAWNTNISWQIDDRGLTTRLVHGYLQIPLMRTGGASSTTVSTSADALRNQINVILPYGFKRLAQTFDLSADRTKLTFTIIDQEVDCDDFLPPGIARGNLKTSLFNQQDCNFYIWTLDISGSFERAPGTPRSWAFQKIALLMATVATNLTTNLPQMPVITNPPATNPADNVPYAMPQNLRIDHDILGGRTTSFSVKFFIYANPAVIIASANLFAPLGDTWILWAGNMAQQWSTRGAAQLTYDPTSDTLIDSCNSGQTLVRDESAPYVAPLTGLSLFDCSDISEENSIVAYNNTYTFDQQENAVIVQPSQIVNPPDPTPAQFQSENGATAIMSPVDQSAQPPVFQYQGAPYIWVTMRGACMRIGYKPVPPNGPDPNDFPGWKIKFVKGTSTPAKVVARWGDCYVYLAEWEYHFALVSTANNSTTAPVPSRPPGY